MSTLTPCNRCSLNAIQRRLKPGDEIRIVAGAPWNEVRVNGAVVASSDTGGRWTEVYVNGGRVASFMELTDECAC